MTKSELKAKANGLPLTPGVYIMKDKQGTIIYVGKAKALKNRVTQYFGSHTNHSMKVIKMVTNVDDFDYILCDTEFEALILENSLIKQNQPKYNILLKDDKGYHYVKITDDKWKKIEWVKQKDKDGKYIGPYHSGAVVKNAVDEALRIFKLPDCNRSFDKPSKPCLNFHIGRCSGPCRGKVSLSDYLEAVDSAVAFIKKGGYGEEDIKKLRLQMEAAAERLDFEQAARLRDRIEAVNKIAQRQKVISSVHKNQDVFACAVIGNTACLQMLKFREWHLCDQEHFIFEDISSRAELYGEFLVRFYSRGNDIPQSIIIDELPEAADTTEEWLSTTLGGSVKITVPQKGELKKTLDMCRSNAAETLSKRIERTGKETAALEELGVLLGMNGAPRYIESYDISNTAGNENVASMVVFCDGRPLKANYRKFKIKSFSGQDDYRSMAEVIHRRLSEYEKQEDSAFSTLPDLILLDGGKGQISAVQPVLEAHNVNVPLFGMVKDSKHRTRAIAANDGDIAIKPTKSAFVLVTRIQDETHRFAITFHKKRMSKGMTKSELNLIDGVGEKRIAALFKHFKTLKNIKSATLQELNAVKGIDKKTAENIYNHFNK
ncbi:MAG: excinuclease ABC subunit UvrC [Clostridia bacterium]|nr:excinuclease ABC subunit UvrC [Clostridia bacterium]